MRFRRSALTKSGSLCVRRSATVAAASSKRERGESSGGASGSKASSIPGERFRVALRRLLGRVGSGSAGELAIAGKEVSCEPPPPRRVVAKPRES